MYVYTYLCAVKMLLFLRFLFEFNFIQYLIFRPFNMFQLVVRDKICRQTFTAATVYMCVRVYVYVHAAKF